MNKFDQIEKNLAWHKKVKPRELVISYEMGLVRNEELEEGLKRFLSKFGWYYKEWNVDNTGEGKRKYLFFKDKCKVVKLKVDEEITFESADGKVVKKPKGVIIG